ncbi:unnamed protein product [Peronospora farinosa]|uniref:Uncharacterized protein n=1 Tax=Peronospora farinosa TaxID=134698 RepID=A0AAV0U5L8_9STRA|nr:unnamed protein product [Peronospora farinosa]
MDNPARSSSSSSGLMTSRKPLATRVLSVDSYWQVLRKLKGRSPKEILVPLWPGESLQQYEREFRRWLAADRLSITDLRKDPTVKRKYRLQFAETRVGRSRSHSQTMTCHSRWQSRSRSPKRSDNNLQQRHHASSREERMQSYGRRSSIDSGRMVIGLELTDRLRHDRSYVRWHSQTDRYPDADEPPRPYSNWQAPHGDNFRYCQDDRVSPPHDVHRRYDNDTQRWKHSRSRSPQYDVRVASPPHGRDE